MWILVKQYAINHGLSLTTVYKKVKRGLIQSKKKGMTLYLWEQDANPLKTQGRGLETEDSVQDEQSDQINDNQEWQKLQNEEKKLKLQLQLEKLKNLRQDTIIKKQKTSVQKDKYRVEFCEGVLQSFTESFAELKNFIIDLKLNKEQLSIFNSRMKKCIKAFDERLKKYIADKDKEEEKEDENWTD